MSTARASSPMRAYRAKKDSQRKSVGASYQILGFLASGTYGRVYKARDRSIEEHDDSIVAIKKFKPDKDGEVLTYTGISQSACREIMLNRELGHINLAALREVILEDKSIYMIFEYAEHDFLQIIHHHATARSTIPVPVLKTLLWQLLNGITYLHDNWVIHRDLKPANILVTHKGEVKIGDLGLARIYAGPLQSLYSSDKVVVTIWYRSPDLLLGARHYTTSIDLWSAGCIFGELLALRPMFKGEEAKLEAPTSTANNGQKKSSVPFQRDQLQKIFDTLGVPNKHRWPTVTQLPEYSRLSEFQAPENNLYAWYRARAGRSTSSHGFDLLSQLLTYDPAARPTARDVLLHPWWDEEPKLAKSAFPENVYPSRKLSHDESDPKIAASSYKTGSGPIAAPASRPAKRSRLE